MRPEQLYPPFQSYEEHLRSMYRSRTTWTAGISSVASSPKHPRARHNHCTVCQAFEVPSFRPFHLRLRLRRAPFLTNHEAFRRCHSFSSGGGDIRHRGHGQRCAHYIEDRLSGDVAGVFWCWCSTSIRVIGAYSLPTAPLPMVGGRRMSTRTL